MQHHQRPNWPVTKVELIESAVCLILGFVAVMVMAIVAVALGVK